MNGVRRPARALRRISRRLMQFLQELNYWQRRKAVLSLAPDRYLMNPDKAPDTYREFLARTYGPLIREPSFKARLAGRRVG
jgi:hypothetical protein